MRRRQSVCEILEDDTLNQDQKNFMINQHKLMMEHEAKVNALNPKVVRQNIKSYEEEKAEFMEQFNGGSGLKIDTSFRSAFDLYNKKTQMEQFLDQNNLDSPHSPLSPFSKGLLSNKNGRKSKYAQESVTTKQAICQSLYDDLNSDYQVQLEVFYRDNVEAFASRFSPNDETFSVGYADGKVIVYKTRNGLRKQIFYADNQKNLKQTSPICCLKYYPTLQDQQEILVTASANGYVQHWHPQEGKLISSHHDSNNQISSLDISSDSKFIVIGGNDAQLKLYDTQKQDICQYLKSVEWQSIGHSNKLFGIKFFDLDGSQMLVSGGSDKNVLLWDVRQEKAVNSLFGYNVQGDSLDVKENQLLIGAYQLKDNLQIVDIRTMKVIQNIDWFEKQNRKLKKQGKVMRTFINCAQFSPNSKYFIAGSSGENDVKIYKYDKQQEKYQPHTKVSNIDSSIFNVDASKIEKRYLISAANSQTYYINQ